MSFEILAGDAQDLARAQGDATVPMTFATGCSGICAPEQAWAGLPWTCKFRAEIDGDCNSVSDYHFPEVPNLGAIENITAADGPVDLWCAGTPCQSFSVAGLRAGLADPRGNLALEFLRVARDLRAEWVVWENVPGVLSSLSHDAPDPVPPPPPVDLGCDGAEVETEDDYDAEEVHAFNSFLAGLSELGYRWAYRVLDAQHFGVPQRRRRVFVVGHLGDGAGPAAVLFERESLRWNTPPRREARENVAALTARGVGTCGADDNQAQAGHLVAPDYERSVSAVTSHSGDKGDGDMNVSTVILGSAVRRLTPRECERLQGFPDDWTLVPFANGLMADSPRYRMIGNSMAVPVVRWIGERIQAVREVQAQRAV